MVGYQRTKAFCNLVYFFCEKKKNWLKIMFSLFHCVEIDLVAEQAEDFVVFFKLFSSYLET